MSNLLLSSISFRYRNVSRRGQIIVTSIEIMHIATYDMKLNNEEFKNCSNVRVHVP